jgi:hypothetical protein
MGWLSGDGSIAPWEAWVRSTGLSHYVLHHWWMWPAMETLHYFGLSLLLGTVGLFDLRVLGLAKAIPPAALHRLVPLGVTAWLLNLGTGIVFFSGFPEQYAYNHAFHFKLVFMALAGLNVLAFYSGPFRRVRAMQAGEDAPTAAKVMAGISLSAWVAVLVCGRLLTFFRPPFFH